MERTLSSFSIKYLTERHANNKLNFDFAIQRDSDQWNKEQMSLLIHSVVSDMIVPTIYLTKENTNDGEVWTVIDGKQRLTTLMSFANNGFKLSKTTPGVVINGEEYNIGGLTYSELPKPVQEKFDLYSIDTAFLFKYTEDDLEDQFYRLNNGSIFTKQQKAVVKLGGKLAEKLKEIEHHPFWDRTNITNIQKRHGTVMEIILKSLMLLTNYNYTHFGAAEVIKFAEYYSENYNDQEIEYLAELIDKLNISIPTDDDTDKLLKPINIPIFLMNLEYFESLNQPMEKYEEFITEWCLNDCESSEYMNYCGSGSTNRNKVWGRIEVINRYLDNFLNGKFR